MRISDWSSDVCSSDLVHPHVVDLHRGGKGVGVDAQLPAPFTANGEVEQQVEAAVERPGVGAAAFVAEREHLIVVEVTTDARGRPGDEIAVNFGKRGGTCGALGFLCSDSVGACFGWRDPIKVPEMGHSGTP